MRDEPAERRYTMREANDALPDLRQTLEAMREARRLVIDSAERVRTATAGNGGVIEEGLWQRRQRDL